MGTRRARVPTQWPQMRCCQRRRRGTSVALAAGACLSEDGVHPTVRSFVPFLLTAALLTTLTPADAFAQRRGGGGRVAVPAPAHRGYYRPGSYHRPYYGHYRPYYYRPYYRS